MKYYKEDDVWLIIRVAGWDINQLCVATYIGDLHRRLLFYMNMNMNMSIMMMMRRCRRLIMAGGGCLFKPSKASYFTAERISNWDLERLEAAKNEVQGFSNNVLIPPHGEGHVAVSPHSFHVIFALLAAGSTDWTAEHWAHFFNQYSPLGISYSVGILNNLLLRNNDDHSSFPIRSSTFLWHHPQLSLHTRFLETLYQHPTLSILPLDFHNVSTCMHPYIFVLFSHSFP